MPMPELSTARWRKSSFSTSGGSCVEVTPLPDGRIAVRNSNGPKTSVVFSTRPDLAAWIKGAKAGEFDDLS